MSEHSILETREKAIGRRAALLFVLFMMLGWVGVMAGDWYFRFPRYSWHRGLITYPGGRPVQEDQALPLFRTNQVPAQVGGDLSNLAGFRGFAERFEQERPAYLRVVDRYGYQNRPYDPETAPDIVVVGDSFMAVGSTDSQFSSKLADRSELFVYNHAVMGRGPFSSIYRFIDSPRFRDQPPKLLVWGFAEREIGGHAFAGMAYQLNRREHWQQEAPIDEAPVRANRPRFYWGGLSPHRLQGSLPDSSLLAQAGEWLWNRTRYYLFRQVSPHVVVSAVPVENDSILFFRYHIDMLARERDPYRMYQVARGFEMLRDFLKARGVPLLVVLIPEKEQVYRHAVPPHFDVPDEEAKPSVLWKVEADLRELGIPVVNLLGPFHDVAQRGKLIYWRDDTHWNVRGREIAVDKTWREIRRHFPELAQEAENE